MLSLSFCEKETLAKEKRNLPSDKFREEWG
jgi:hypothetical protein